ncbi:hypothetical protein [Sphingomonas turrisvirgatae]|nr:hypothetical protein [Sphingomonas turrisvirgatae]
MKKNGKPSRGPKGHPPRKRAVTPKLKKDTGLHGSLRVWTEADSCKQDLKRAAGLINVAEAYPVNVDAAHARRLARKLYRSGDKGDFPDNPASSLRMFVEQAWIVAALLALHRLYTAAMAPITFAIVPRHWTYRTDELDGADIRKMMEAFRTDLYKAGARAAGGWLYVFLHGEYDGEHGVFRLHLHGLCSREMIPVLRALREFWRYKTSKCEKDGSRAAIYRPIRMRLKPLYNMPAPISYIVKAFWPSRPVFIGADGTRRRVRSGQRIPEPHHSQVLLWLDRWKVTDLELLIGLRRTKSGFVRTQRGMR